MRVIERVKVYGRTLHAAGVLLVDVVADVMKPAPPLNMLVLPAPPAHRFQYEDIKPGMSRDAKITAARTILNALQKDYHYIPATIPCGRPSLTVSQLMGTWD